jgi:hypothetical protein
MKPILTGDVEELQKISLLERAFQPFRKFLPIAIICFILGLTLTIAGIGLLFEASGWELALLFGGVFLIVTSLYIASRYTVPRKAYQLVLHKKQSMDNDWLLTMAYYNKHTKLYDNALMLYSLYALIDMTVPEVEPILVRHHKEVEEHPTKKFAYEEPLHVLARKLGYQTYLEMLKKYE